MLWGVTKEDLLQNNLSKNDPENNKKRKTHKKNKR